MRRKTLTKAILTKLIVKVLTTVNQNNFLTLGATQDLEKIKIAKIVNEFFVDK